MSIRWTDIQRNVMDLVIRGNSDGTFADLNQLVERSPHKPTKDAMRSTIRFLVKHGMVETEHKQQRGARRMIVKPTIKGYQARRPS